MKEKTTAAPIRWPWPGCLDALEAAPRHHRLLSENDRVRVLEVRIPGANMFAATERAGWSSIRARLGTCPWRITELRCRLRRSTQHFFNRLSPYFFQRRTALLGRTQLDLTRALFL